MMIMKKMIIIRLDLHATTPRGHLSNVPTISHLVPPIHPPHTNTRLYSTKPHDCVIFLKETA
jgi:hypothetical protein